MVQKKLSVSELFQHRLKRIIKFLVDHKLLVDAFVVGVISTIAFVIAFLNYDIYRYIDGGYYWLEVKSLITSGKLYYSAPPLYFIISSLFSIIFGIETGLRIASSLLIALLIPSFFFGVYIIKGRKEAYFTLPLTFWSKTFFKMYGNLSKNLLSLAFFPIILAALWKLKESNKRTKLYLATLFFGIFGMVISHLPSSLLAIMTAGIFVLITLLEKVYKNFRDLPKHIKIMKNPMRNKNLRHLFSYSTIRIIAALGVICIALLLGLIINNVFPHVPNTWYSSSDIPSKNYGNTEAESPVQLSRFLQILLTEHILFLIFLAFLLCVRPKSWTLILSSILAFSFIDLTIDSISWFSRLKFDFEVVRILLYVISLGKLTDFLEKITTKLYFILSKKRFKISLNIHPRSLWVMLLSAIVLSATSIVVSTSFSVERDRFFIR